MQTIRLIHFFYKGNSGIWKHYATRHIKSKHDHVNAMEERDTLHFKGYEVVTEIDSWDLPD